MVCLFLYLAACGQDCSHRGEVEVGAAFIRESVTDGPQTGSADHHLPETCKIKVVLLMWKQFFLYFCSLFLYGGLHTVGGSSPGLYIKLFCVPLWCRK